MLPYKDVTSPHPPLTPPSPLTPHPPLTPPSTLMCVPPCRECCIKITCVNNIVTYSHLFVRAYTLWCVWTHHNITPCDYVAYWNETDSIH